MIIYDHKIFEDMPNNTNNDTYVIISIITVNKLIKCHRYFVKEPYDDGNNYGCIIQLSITISESLLSA